MFRQLVFCCAVLWFSTVPEVQPGVDSNSFYVQFPDGPEYQLKNPADDEGVPGYYNFKLRQEILSESPLRWRRFLRPLPEVFTDEKVVALTEASVKGDLIEIDRLVKEGANVNAIGLYSVTPLLYTMWSGNLKGYTRLLEHKADPNHCWDDAESAVHYAAYREDAIWLVLALRHGGDPNVRGVLRFSKPLGRLNDYRQPTPLECLCGSFFPYRHTQYTNAALLIAAGADLEAKNSKGERPFEIYMKHGTTATAYLMLQSGTSLEGDGGVAVKNAVKAMRTRNPDTTKYPKEVLYYTRQLIKFLDDRGINTTPDPL